MIFQEFPKWVFGRIVINADDEASWRATAESLKQVIADVAVELAPAADEPDEFDQPLLPKQKRGRPKKAE